MENKLLYEFLKVEREAEPWTNQGCGTTFIMTTL